MSNRFISDRGTPASDTGDGPPRPPVGTPFDRPPVEVISPNQVAIATLFGGPLAGGIAISISHQRAGSDRTAWPVIIGVLVGAVLGGLVFLLGTELGLVLPLMAVAIMRAYAQAQQAYLDESVGGRTVPGGWGTPIVLGLAVGAVMGILYFIMHTTGTR